jgi:hypothetical protein
MNAEPSKKARRYYTKHGLTTLDKAVRVLGGLDVGIIRPPKTEKIFLSVLRTI